LSQSPAILEELRGREPIFHHPELGTTRRDYEAMTDPDLQQGQRVTRRATLWRRTAAGWQALYHQGTLVEAQA
jgi:hypothetical protein